MVGYLPIQWSGILLVTIISTWLSFIIQCFDWCSMVQTLFISVEKLLFLCTTVYVINSIMYKTYITWKTPQSEALCNYYVHLAVPLTPPNGPQQKLKAVRWSLCSYRERSWYCVPCSVTPGIAEIQMHTCMHTSSTYAQNKCLITYAATGNETTPCVQCESKNPSLRFCGNFSKTVGNFSTKFYLPIMRYVILSVTTQFTSCAQNAHRWLKRAGIFWHFS